MEIIVDTSILGDQIWRHCRHCISSPSIGEGYVEHIVPVVSEIHKRFLSDTPFAAERERRVESLVLVLSESVGSIQTRIEVDNISVIITVDSSEIFTQLVGYGIHNARSVLHILVESGLHLSRRSGNRCNRKRDVGISLSSVSEVAVSHIGETISLVGSHLETKVHSQTVLLPESVVIYERSSYGPVEGTVVLGVQQPSIRERACQFLCGVRLDRTVFISSDGGDIIGILRSPGLHIHGGHRHTDISLELEMIQEIPAKTEIGLESLSRCLCSGIFYFIEYIVIVIILVCI